MLMLLSLQCQYNWRVYCRCLLLLLNMMMSVMMLMLLKILISVLIISWSWWPNLVRSTSVLHKAEILFQKFGKYFEFDVSFFTGWMWVKMIKDSLNSDYPAPFFMHASFMPCLCPLMVGKKGRWWWGYVLIGKKSVLWNAMGDKWGGKVTSSWIQWTTDIQS